MTGMSVRMELLYRVREGAVVRDVLGLLRAPSWVRSVMRLTAPQLKDASPADSSVLAKLENEWRILPESRDGADAKNTTSCVICMDDSTQVEEGQGDDASAVRLLCGHEYHFQCVRSWLQQRSSCPVCRYQFPKALSGKFALQRVQSMLVLEDAYVLQLPRGEVVSAAIVRDRVRVIVTVRLQQVNAGQDQSSSIPCELSACVAGPNGELLSDTERPTSPVAFSGPEQDLTAELSPQAGECHCVESDETRKYS
ncbi:hypothetical protein Gpo141_00014242 [Globisporangium polare]